MAKSGKQIINFLDEIKEFNNIKKGRPFKIDLKDKNGRIDFKWSIIEDLYYNGAIKVLNEFNGEIRNKKGEIVKLAEGANLKMFGLNPTAIEIIINKDKFNNYYKEKKRELKEFVNCSYNREVFKISFNNKEIEFKKETGLILFFLYKYRIFNQYRTYVDYNDFIKRYNFYSEPRIIKYDAFRRAVDDANKRIAKETDKYIKSIIDKKKDKNSRKNKYKWIERI